MPATLYAVLSLPAPGSDVVVSPSALKAAYKRALLVHHPDKKTTGNLGAKSKSSGHTGTAIVPHYTVDEILRAYNILSDPKQRAEYDRELLLGRARFFQSERAISAVQETFSGFEIVDLEDMRCDEGKDGDASQSVWWRGCRCGNERGFMVTEGDLETAFEEVGEEAKMRGTAEIIVGCQGCSLGLRIGFGVLEDGEGEG